MKTDFSINVSVSIGVTPEVTALVAAILTKKPTATIEVPASEQPSAEAPIDAAPAHAEPKRGRKAKTQTAEEPKAEEPAEEPKAEEPAEEPAKEPKAEEPAAEAPTEGKEPTAEDVRKAMDRARVRIEGEYWETNITSEGRTKYHKQLTATFKNIASLLGSDKPSTLPEENRRSFINQCDALVVENGEITTHLPF